MRLRANGATPQLLLCYEGRPLPLHPRKQDPAKYTMHSVFTPAVHLAPCDYGSRRLRNYGWWRRIDVRMQNWIPSSSATWKWILYDNWPISAHSFPYKLPYFITTSFPFDTLPLKIGPIGCPETSVLKQPVLRNNPEDGRVHIYYCLKFSQIPSLFLTISFLPL